MDKIELRFDGDIGIRNRHAEFFADFLVVLFRCRCILDGHFFNFALARENLRSHFARLVPEIVVADGQRRNTAALADALFTGEHGNLLCSDDIADGFRTGSRRVVGGDVDDIAVGSSVFCDGRNVVGVGEGIASAGQTLAGEIFLNDLDLILGVCLCRTVEQTDRLGIGQSSSSASACSVRGAKSEVPETLPPTVPLKSLMPNATPYSVMEVPRIGMVAVAFCAACSAGVAFAMIRSTFLDTKLLTMVVQVAESFAAF